MCKIVGVLLLTLVFGILLFIRLGLNEPIYLFLLYISILCLSICLFRDKRRLMTTPIIYLLIMLFYLILTLSSENSLKIFSLTLAIILILYLLYLTRDYILLLPLIISIYFLLKLIKPI